MDSLELSEEAALSLRAEGRSTERHADQCVADVGTRGLLAQVSGGAGDGSAPDEARLEIGAQEDDAGGKPWHPSGDARPDFDPVEARHLDVEQCDVGLEPLDQRERAGPIE